MINVNIRIITRTIPATPRSQNYPQGYITTGSISNTPKNVAKSSDVTANRSLYQSQIDIVQFIKNNRAEVIAALMDENGILSVKGSIKATGNIVSNQTFE